MKYLLLMQMQFIADELNTLTHNLSADFSLRDCSFEAIKPTKNAYSNKN